MSAKPRNKVFILGLDGATSDLLDGWVSQGLLPTIERLRIRFEKESHLSRLRAV